jgi:hypothetical protein
MRGSSLFGLFFRKFPSDYKHLASYVDKMVLIKMLLETMAWKIYLRIGLSYLA